MISKQLFKWIVLVFLSFSMAILICASTNLFAAPYDLSYNGRMTLDSGAPVEGPVNLEVKFFRSESGSDEIAVAVPDFSGVILNEGAFQILISLTPSQFHTVFTSTDPVWIQVKDLTNNVPYPRQIFSAVPYAFKTPTDNSTITYNSDGKLSVLNSPKIGGQNVANDVPTNGQILQWDGALSLWKPSAAEASSGGTLTQIDTGTGLTGGPINVSGTISLANSGVSAGDYTKVTVDTKGRVTVGTSIAASDLPSNIDASKIGGGAVDSTEFNYLNGVTSSIQTQFTNKSDAGHTHASSAQGPASSTDNGIVRYDGVSGKLVQDSSNVVIDDSGKVGIGTTSPAANLHILGTGQQTVQIQTSDDSVSAAQLVGNGKTWQISKRPTATTNDRLGIYYHNGVGWSGELMTMTTDGNLGIGTTSPAAKLHVNGAIKVPSGTTQAVLYADANASNTPAEDSFRIRYDADFFGATTDALIIEKTDGNGSDPDGGIAFLNTGNDGNQDVSMVIRGSGKVGIGTTSPATKLDVNGSIAIDGANAIKWKLYSGTTGTTTTSFVHGLTASKIVSVACNIVQGATYYQVGWDTTRHIRWDATNITIQHDGWTVGEAYRCIATYIE